MKGIKTYSDLPNPLLSILLGAILLAVGSAAHAGGLQAATDAATTVKTWLYGFMGVLAFVYVGWKIMEAWTDRGHWMDVGKALGWVAAGGALLVVVPWAWNMFTG
ncbi:MULTISPECIES: hypothetical protein [Burkholderia]|uniref:hypothetical protein n=1 Tax=Burkholderia TaxID=32008 RepID=UPI000536C9FD|nr:MULTISPECIES: hypothetical protein [Burkholderia]KGV73774.1 putative membrane protein [Burkholderia pseudomallei MSHR4299]KGW11100.1 putative membrane protein [Burkholderia pseudomallei MSHR4000]KWN79250.1 hypothetical protein WM24_27420 [Burkholderia ubonensis]